ncbi:hypothetical protein CDAR_488841 [Caerostris darwini]|uniref:Uncharacterized protein n=1 Tax=Caerostris darwini TaxID=1538125 RepID=A0AAV4VJ28_9ARAC|nr:hypothetical protein CDAR_488841 [Caerostris darwini]
MIVKIALLTALAAVDATVLAPGHLNAGIISPAAIRTGSVVAIPGAISTDSRIIGTPGLIGSPLLLNNGLIGTPLGLRSAILGGPGLVKTVW